MRAAVALFGLGLMACTGSITVGSAADDDDLTGDAGDPPAADAGTPAGGDGAPVDHSPDAAPVDPGDVAAVCNRWKSDRSGLGEGAWTGSVATCEPGDLTAPARESALRLINLYRWMSGLPAVTDSEGLNASAQSCALMMRANNALSHMPPDTWACYSSEGAAAAGRSNISSGRAVVSVDAYMADNFAPTSLGHRRWILSAGLGPVGIGGTDRHSCLWVISGVPGGGPAWTAFPAPGVFPYEGVKPYLYSIDEAGWSIQSNSIDLRAASVSITADGVPAPVAVNVLGSGYGSSYAIAMVPQGWTTQPDTDYHVRVTGVTPVIEYDVHVVDCDAL